MKDDRDQMDRKTIDISITAWCHRKEIIWYIMEKNIIFLVEKGKGPSLELINKQQTFEDKKKLGAEIPSKSSYKNQRLQLSSF